MDSRRVEGLAELFKRKTSDRWLFPLSDVAMAAWSGVTCGRKSNGRLVLESVEIVVFEPTRKYQNVVKSTGVMKLTPARALVAEMVRRYWVLGIECTYLEVQKLCWFLERTIRQLGIEDPLDLHSASRTGMAHTRTGSGIC